MEAPMWNPPGTRGPNAKDSTARLKAWLKIINWRGKRTRQGDSTDIRFLQWAMSKAKAELTANDFAYFMIAYGNRYREALRGWARAAIARKKASNV